LLLQQIAAWRYPRGERNCFSKSGAHLSAALRRHRAGRVTVEAAASLSISSCAADRRLHTD